MRILTFLVVALSALCLSTGCSSDCIFQQSFEVPNAEWTYEDPIRFEFEIPDTSARYNLNLALEHSTDYPYQNLYVKFHTQFPSGKTVEQVVSLELTDKAILWQGECSGKWCTINIPLQTGAIFPEPGKHSITLEQYTRDNPIKGVKSFSLCIQPATAAD
ncbi:MAG: gliding motility lipoprotein GldH [Saprospiraceae bacterium]|nr:hypothetical protein [Saprospirales bacterium]